MKKATCLLTNSRAVEKVFKDKYCDQSHSYQRIEGSEQGVRRSQFAQAYPSPMVNGICTAILEEAKNFEAFQ